jgi:hypothetical protein
VREEHQLMGSCNAFLEACAECTMQQRQELVFSRSCECSVAASPGCVITFVLCNFVFDLFDVNLMYLAGDAHKSSGPGELKLPILCHQMK